MTKLLMVVEDRFGVAYRGTMLAPPLPAGRARNGLFRVELRRPDGTRVTRTATATASFSHPQWRDQPVWVCLVNGLREHAPAGTEVWFDPEP